MQGLELFFLLMLALGSLFYIGVARREVRFALYGKEDWETRFRRHQKRRRRSILVLAALAVGAIALGLSVSHRNEAALFMTSWVLAVFLLLWILLLGFLEMLAVRLHFRTIRDRETVEGVVLKYQLRRELEQETSSDLPPEEKS